MGIGDGWARGCGKWEVEGGFYPEEEPFLYLFN